MNERIIFRLIGILQGRLGLYILTVVGVAVTLTLRQVYLAWVLKDLFEHAVSGSFSELISTVILGLVIVAVLGVIRPFLIYLEERLVCRAVGELKKKLYQKIMNLPIDYFSREHSGEIISRLTNDIREIEIALSTRFLYLLSYSLCAVSVTVAMFFLDFWLALIALITAALALTANAVFSHPLREVSRNVQIRLGGLTGCLTDMLAGVKVTRAFNLYQSVNRKFATQNGAVYRTEIKRVKLTASLAAMNDFGKMIDIIGVMGIGAFLSIQGKVSVGAIIAVWQLKTPILMIFKELGDLTAGLQAGLAGAERVFGLLDEPEEPQNYCHLEGEVHPEQEQALVIKDVDFGYHPLDRVLCDLTLEVKKGQKVAIVGPSGEGKSTIFKILLGFYPPEKGNVSIDGESFGHTDLDSLRRKIAYVPQNAYLFSGTIKENIRYGRMNATDEEIIAAAHEANAHDFIMGFDEGYETYVGERGAQLSGGQRQRIGIARAILRDAPIFLFDEATSALDTEAESLIAEALKRLSAGRTIVMITHRFSLIRDADMIYVVADGQVSEKGTHPELIAIADGMYRRLYEQQYDLLEAI